MKSIFLFLIIAGVAVYAWTTRVPDAADVFDLAPAAAYEKLRNGKMPNTKASKTYEYETIISGNGSDKITLSEDSDARKHGVRFTRIAEEDKLLLDQFLRGELHEEAAAV